MWSSVQVVCHSQRVTDVVSMRINKQIPSHAHYKAIERDLVMLCYDMCGSLPASWTAGVVGTWKLLGWVWGGQRFCQWKKMPLLCQSLWCERHKVFDVWQADT